MKNLHLIYVVRFEYGEKRSRQKVTILVNAPGRAYARKKAQGFAEVQGFGPALKYLLTTETEAYAVHE